MPHKLGDVLSCSDRYILQGKQPIECPDLLEWGAWLETADRAVAATELFGCCVSTVFLGLDHNWDPDAPPALFETMVFGGACDGDCWRYSTWEEAEATHQAIAEEVQAMPDCWHVRANFSKWLAAATFPLRTLAHRMSQIFYFGRAAATSQQRPDQTSR